jgi:TPR repeat protein
MNDSTKKEKEKGMRLLAHLAKENCKHAQARLGLLHLQGEIVKKDPKKVMQYWKAGAVQGHIFCIISLAHLYQEGKEISKDDKQAFYYFEQATKQNDAHAYNMLGLYLTAGRSVPKDVQRACACFEAAYNLDIKDDTAEEIKIGLAFKGKKKPIAPFAAFNLGRLYCYGNNNFRSNDNWAIYWLKRAVEQGHESAIELLAFVYYKSERYEELFITFKAWAENGNVEAMFILGLFLIGSGQSHGLYWMNAAAMKGHPKAASFLEQRNAEDSQRSVTMYNVINSLKANSHELITTEEASRTVENIVDAQSKHLKEEVNASYTISTAEIKAVELTEEVDTSIQPIAAPTVVAQANSNPNIQPKPVAVDNKPRMSSTTFFSIGAAAVAVVSVVAYNMM